MESHGACRIDGQQFIVAIGILGDAIEADVGLVCMYMGSNEIDWLVHLWARRIASYDEQLLMR